MARDLLLEVGAEEIPASFVEPALEDLRRAIVQGAADARLSHGEVQLFGTPRRLAVRVREVADCSADLSRQVLGPSVKAAFDAQGKPTKAAEKFAEGQKVPVAQLSRVQTPKGEYLAAAVEEKGRGADQVLAPILQAAIHGIGFRKSMRWGDVELTFARPVHWVVALLGTEVIPLVMGDVRSGRVTYGHRFLAPQPIELSDPAQYEQVLEKASVVPDAAKRKALLLERVQKAAQAAGGKLLEDPALLDQVTYLVELPNPVVGTFEERHLDLPAEVLVQEMKSHQRYFSVVNAEGKLLPRFVAVSNTPVRDEKLSLRGYERVLRSRLADGRFFFDEDRKTPLASRLEKLSRVVWQGKLGSYAEKVERVRKLSRWLAERVGVAKELWPVVDRAAQLSKADLVTGMVGEFPELQGVMGREYARASGEPEGVAVAIFEHYLPRGAGDALPSQDPGTVIGIADRLDSLAGLFAIGKAPSSAADPFGLRRACLAVIHLVLHRGYRLSLKEAIGAAVAGYQDKLGAKGTAQALDGLLEFFRGRLKVLWAETYRTDLVEAVLSAGFDDLTAARLRLTALADWVKRPDFAALATAFKRVVNIVEKQGKDVAKETGTVDAGALVDPAEKALHQALVAVSAQVGAQIQRDDYAGALERIASLKPAVDAFFEKVMVMAEDSGLRRNRLRLLVGIGALFGRVADFSKIQSDP